MAPLLGMPMRSPHRFPPPPFIQTHLCRRRRPVRSAQVQPAPALPCFSSTLLRAPASHPHPVPNSSVPTVAAQLLPACIAFESPLPALLHCKTSSCGYVNPTAYVNPTGDHSPSRAATSRSPAACSPPAAVPAESGSRPTAAWKAALCPGLSRGPAVPLPDASPGAAPPTACVRWSE